MRKTPVEKEQTQPEQSPDEPLFQKVGECLYRRQSSQVYYALVKRAGKQHRKSLKTTDRKLAERLLADYRREIGAVKPTVGGRSVTLGEVAKRWLEAKKPFLKPMSFKRCETSVGQLCRLLGTVAVRKISPTMLEDWASKRIKEGRSPKGLSASTYNNERDTLIAILDQAKRDGHLLDNVAEALPRRKGEKKAKVIPSKEDFAKLVQVLRACDHRSQAAADLVELAAYTGARLGEVTTMRWRDILFEKGRFVITGGEKGTKNSEARERPLFPAARALLERMRERDKPQPDDLIISITSAKRALTSACKKAGIPRLTHHVMRHFFVSNAIEAGVDFKTIADWIGHKDGGVLVAKTYGHLRDAHSFEMAKKMTFSA